MSYCTRCGIAGTGGYCGGCGQPLASAAYRSPIRDREQAWERPRNVAPVEVKPMTFGLAIRLGYKNIFDYRGKATNPEYWWFYLYLFLSNLGLGTISSIFTSESVTSLLVSLVASILAVVNLLAFVSLLVRRFHDTGRSGWRTLICIIPIFGIIYLLIVTTRDSHPSLRE